MSLVIKLHRGKKSTMNGTKKNTILQSGEVFLEYPDNGIGTGASKIKVGDGKTQYSNLPYALGEYADTAGTANSVAWANTNHPSTFPPSSHTHSINDITSGTLPITRGGTGATDATTARNNIGAAASNHNHDIRYAVQYKGEFNEHNVYLKLGTATIVQDGSYVNIEICDGEGYNAMLSQDRHYSIHLRASNGAANNSKYYSAYVEYCLGGNGHNDVYVVQLSSTKFEFWIGILSYSGRSFYICTMPDGCTWDGTQTKQSALPSGADKITQYQIAYKSDLSSYVPTSRTVNGHALTDNISVSKSDVGLGNVDNTSDNNKAVYEARLKWGGTNISGDISPVDAAMSSVHSANRAAFSNPKGITVEYSTNNGSTWTDYGLSDSDKISLVSGLQATIFCGKHSSTNTGTINDRLRVTVNASTCGFYTALKKVLIDVSTNGVSGAKVLIERSINGATPSYSTLGTYDVNGWSGWNSIPINCAFGGGVNRTDNIGYIRFTFFFTGVSSTSYINSLSVNSFLFFGTTAWGYQAQLAKDNHLYTYDSGQNATFPAAVKASSFQGTLNGTVNFSNASENLVGDDVSIGDVNIAGALGIKGKNSTTGIALIDRNQTNWSGPTNYGLIQYNGTNIVVNKTISGSITGNAGGLSDGVTVDCGNEG